MEPAMLDFAHSVCDPLVPSPDRGKSERERNVRRTTTVHGVITLTFTLPYFCIWGFLCGSVVKNPPAKAEDAGYVYSVLCGFYFHIN